MCCAVRSLPRFIITTLNPAIIRVHIHFTRRNSDYWRRKSNSGRRNSTHSRISLMADRGSAPAIISPVSMDTRASRPWYQTWMCGGLWSRQYIWTTKPKNTEIVGIAANPNYPRNSAASCSSTDASASAALWLQSDEYVRASR